MYDREWNALPPFKHGSAMQMYNLVSSRNTAFRQPIAAVAGAVEWSENWGQIRIQNNGFDFSPASAGRLSGFSTC